MFFSNNDISTKNIVYSDIILPLKETGNNIIITSIPNISENLLEECLNTIFKNNPHITFNTIQYSKKNKEIYFYTNQEIKTKEWYKRNIKTHNYIHTNKEILQEIKNILNSKKNTDYNYISLYNIAILIKDKKREHQNIIEYYNEQINNNINEYLIIQDFDYNKLELHINYKYKEEWYNMTFAKNDGDLYLKTSDNPKALNLLVEIGNDLSLLYDELIKYKDFYKQYIYQIKCLNSNFLVNINAYQINLYQKKEDNLFELKLYSYNDTYEYNCNSNNIINTIHNNEDELFKKIFVKIDDCPKWSQIYLYKIRKKQLIKENIKIKIKKILPLSK